MLITTSKAVPGTTYEEQGGKFRIFHAEPMDDILAANKEDKWDANNGFSQDRHFRRIGRMGILDMKRFIDKYPEFLHGSKAEKDRAIRRALLTDPEFEHCRSVRKGI